MKWLCDGSAINRIARESTNYNAAFELLTKLVSEAILTFCDATVVELERTAEGDPAALWVTTAKGQRADSAGHYSSERWVSHNYPDLVDEDARYDAAVQVLAHAKSLRDGGASDLKVVTEDVKDKPTRESLAAACNSIGIPAVQVESLMAAYAMSWP